MAGRRDGLNRVQTIVSGKGASQLLADATREAVNTALSKHLSTFVLDVSNTGQEAVTVRLGDKELGAIEPGASQTFTVAADGLTRALTCARNAAYEPYQQSLEIAPGGGQAIRVADLKAKPR